MYIYSRPNELVESYVEGAPTGLVGTVGYRVINLETNNTIYARTTEGIVETPAGSGQYYTKVTAPNSIGNYGVVWDTGTVTPETSASDVLVVNAEGAVPLSLPGEDIITLKELKVAKGIKESDTTHDARFNLAIEHASAAVRKYCDRQFGKPLVVGVRTYEYEGMGFLDIDDANAVSAVSFIFGGLTTPIQEFYWRPEPQEGPPYTYLTIPHWAGIYSPEMGFTYNLDVISKDRGWPGLIPLVEVKGTWGWAEIPLDVRRATILTAAAFSDVPDPYLAESIANYSYQVAIREGQTAIPGLTPTAIPGRAADLLNPYVRFQI